MLAILTKQYRGAVAESFHTGRICAVDVSSGGNIAYSLGNPMEITYFRSSAKPLQILPAIELDLHKKYGLEGEEIVVMAGSHCGDPEHIAVLKRILQKTGLEKDALVLAPSLPDNPASRPGAVYDKLNHCCSGKHLALMLLERELSGGTYENYYKPDSKCQRAVRQCIADMSLYPSEQIAVGIDGCSVPVYAAPLKNLAISFLRLARPELIRDGALRAAVEYLLPLYHTHRDMVRGRGYLCSYLNEDENIIAKGGAGGVYCFGLKKEGLAVAFKMEDGIEDSWSAVVKSILEQIGYENRQTYENLDTVFSQWRYIHNSLGTVSGELKAEFTLKKH